MKSLIVLLVFCFSAAAFAGEEVATSRFHMLSMKCEAEAGSADSPETTPQSPPLDVDDPATPGCNKWEINFVVDGDLTVTEKNWEVPLLDINYGIGDNLQLKYEVPMETKQSGGSSESNVGYSKFGIKYMFFADEERKVQLAFYPQEEFFIPISKTSKDAVTGNIVTLPLLVSKKIGDTIKGDIMLTANAGYNLSSMIDTPNSVFFSVGVGYPLLKRLSVMGEISDQSDLSKNPDGIQEQLVKANLGVMGTINKAVFAFGSLGQSLYSTDSVNHTYVLAGVRLLSGVFEK